MLLNVARSAIGPRAPLVLDKVTKILSGKCSSTGGKLRGYSMISTLLEVHLRRPLSVDETAGEAKKEKEREKDLIAGEAIAERRKVSVGSGKETTLPPQGDGRRRSSSNMGAFSRSTLMSDAEIYQPKPTRSRMNGSGSLEGKFDAVARKPSLPFGSVGTSEEEEFHVPK